MIFDRRRLAQKCSESRHLSPLSNCSEAALAPPLSTFGTVHLQRPGSSPLFSQHPIYFFSCSLLKSYIRIAVFHLFLATKLPSRRAPDPPKRVRTSAHRHCICNTGIYPTVSYLQAARLRTFFASLFATASCGHLRFFFFPHQSLPSAYESGLRLADFQTRPCCMYLLHAQFGRARRSLIRWIQRSTSSSKIPFSSSLQSRRCKWTSCAHDRD